jgi:hypothetical protein
VMIGLPPHAATPLQPAARPAPSVAIEA